MRERAIFLVVCALCLVTKLQAAHVMINEIMYHPAEGKDAQQYVELFNPTANPIQLAGWKLSGGIKYTFPQNATIGPGQFLVICHDLAQFQRAHPLTSTALGNFTGRLSHKGEKLELVDAAGNIVEKVHFLDQQPWPVGADGYGGSLERICIEGPANEPRNWAASSSRNGARRASGSPGETNSCMSPTLPPSVANVRWGKVSKPNQPIQVTVELAGEAPIKTAVLEYWVVRTGKAGESVELPMTQASEAGKSATYQASIPAQAAGSLVRFTIQVTDEKGATRVEPAPGEPRPALSSFVKEIGERAKIPIVTVVNPEPLRGGGNKFGAARKTVSGPGKGAVLYVPPEGEPQLFDFVQVRRRNGGLKLHFQRDQQLDGMTGVNLIFEGQPRWLLAEHLSYELYRKAGMKIEKSGHVRLNFDGRELGYYLLVEQPNKNFLARTGRSPEGNLYKVQWFGQGIVGQHEKKTNPETGHADILALVEGLNKKSGAAQWAYINENFDVDAFVNYYAVNMCIQNWDGFFNNHYVYHQPGPKGKWEVFPWDEDKTWGEYDGCPSDYSWYDMPLTAGSGSGRSQRSGWFGGADFGGWQRPPGALSGPLLSNPQFREKMEARVRELCKDVFTPEAFGPVVTALQQRLRPEVELKARASGMDPKSALREFDSDIASFHRQLLNRRKYLLSVLK